METDNHGGTYFRPKGRVVLSPCATHSLRHHLQEMTTLPLGKETLPSVARHSAAVAADGFQWRRRGCAYTRRRVREHVTEGVSIQGITASVIVEGQRYFMGPSHHERWTDHEREDINTCK